MDEATSTEEWRWVPGFEGCYEVSDRGRVRSWMRWINTTPPRFLKPHIGRDGYIEFGLRKDDKKKHFFLHRLLLLAFVGEPPEDAPVIRHLDGNKLNNALSNLAYGTVAENTQDSVQHGTQRQVRKTHCPEGHPYDEANTGRGNHGQRRCRICDARRARVRRAEKRSQLPVPPRKGPKPKPL